VASSKFVAAVCLATWGNFRDVTRLVRGPAASVYRGAVGLILEFQTLGGLKTLRQLEPHSATIHTGNTVTAVTEGVNAQRLSSGVVLSNCVVGTPYC
jgi:hypothetical protein